MRTPIFVGLVLALTLIGPSPGVAAPTLALQPCRLPGVEHEAQCGSLSQPLDASQPAGTQIRVRVAVLPAVARNKLPDPVFFFAGGPGQSAVDLAPTVAQMMARVLNRRDVVLVDQRGTGHSAPLTCPDANPSEPLSVALDPQTQEQRWADCLKGLKALPHGDFRHYTTTAAMRDVEAVRQALGLGPINLVGMSYGTRAALEYQRQFAPQVRRMVLDGVAPPDMVLPASLGVDMQASLQALFDDCRADAHCQRHFPGLQQSWQRLLAQLPQEAELTHPLTGRSERLRIRRDHVVQAVRGPLYVPALASGLPYAIQEASQGRFTPLFGLGQSLNTCGPGGLSLGMHLAVVCAEDVPRLPAAHQDNPGLGDVTTRFYRSACAGLPKAEVPDAFFKLSKSSSPVLLLSGGADPATPPRHAQRVAEAMGPQARHVVIPQAGHGVLGLSCMREVVLRFLDTQADLLALDQAVKAAGCASQMPRARAFVPPQTRASSRKPGDPT